MASNAQPTDAAARPTASEEAELKLEEDRWKLNREVCTALALGWQMAELYHGQPSGGDAPHSEKPAGREGFSGSEPPSEDRPGEDRPGKKPRPNNLPGVGSLEPSEKDHLRIAQIAHGLEGLAGATSDEELVALHDQVQEDVEEERMPNDLRKLHVRLLTTLTVADYRLGKAYGFGRALCETTRTGQTDKELKYHLGEERLTRLITWCHDLKSVLPEHTGQAVADSLARWRSWARQRPWRPAKPGNSIQDAGNQTEPPSEPNATSQNSKDQSKPTAKQTDFNRSLSRQGERWRAILTGEKQASDLLDPETYLQAGEALLADAAHVGWDFAKKFWPALLLALLLLVGGILIILLGSGGANVFAGLASVAASLGITWKTATPTLSKLAGKLAAPLWGAELDAAITVAVTDPIVPASSATPPSLDQPVPVSRATDARTTRKTAREVWKRLDRGTRRRALAGRMAPRRLYYRYAGLWRGGSRAAFMPHDAYLNRVQSALEERLVGKDLETSASSRDELFSEFGPDDWGWITTIVHAGLTTIEGKHDFREDPSEQPMNDERVRIVLFGDWATGTVRAQRLADRMRECLEEVQCERHVIHLGDVYYCGQPDEYRRRLLSDWPAPEEENVHSWNLNGNHDMYSGGYGYFELIEGNPALDPRAEKFRDQNGTSFFRLFNKRWQIIGLDSAYLDNDLTPAQLPKLNAWLGLRGKDPNALPAGAPHRKTLVLTHHQLGSAREQREVGPGIFDKTAAARASGRIDAWFWGHEHRCFVYKPYQGVACPVCIGNGGVPELLSHRFTLTGAFQVIVGLIANVIALFKPRRLMVVAPRVRWKPKRAYVDPQRLRWERYGFVVIDLCKDREEAWYIDEDDDEQKVDSFGDEPRGRAYRTRIRLGFKRLSDPEYKKSDSEESRPTQGAER